MKISFGSTQLTKTIDVHGSTITTETNFLKGKPNYPIRNRYTIRVRVKDKKEELTEYLKFSDSLTPEMLDPGFKLEYTTMGKKEGYYFVIKSWTELTYDA